MTQSVATPSDFRQWCVNTTRQKTNCGLLSHKVYPARIVADGLLPSLGIDRFHLHCPSFASKHGTAKRNPPHQGGLTSRKRLRGRLNAISSTKRVSGTVPFRLLDLFAALYPAVCHNAARMTEAPQLSLHRRPPFTRRLFLQCGFRLPIASRAIGAVLVANKLTRS